MKTKVVIEVSVFRIGLKYPMQEIEGTVNIVLGKICKILQLFWFHTLQYHGRCLLRGDIRRFSLKYCSCS